MDERVFCVFENNKLTVDSKVCLAALHEGLWSKGLVGVVPDIIPSPPESVVQNAQSTDLDLSLLLSLIEVPVVVKQLVD